MEDRPLDANTQVTDNQLLLAIGRLEGKMDSLIRHLQQMEQQLAQFDLRIRKLEAHRAYQTGAAAAIGALSSVLINYFWNKQP